MALWRNSENPAISNPCRYLFAISQPGVYIYAKFSGRFADPLASPSLNVDREALWINRERGKQGITVGTGYAKSRDSQHARPWRSSRVDTCLQPIDKRQS